MNGSDILENVITFSKFLIRGNFNVLSKRNYPEYYRKFLDTKKNHWSLRKYSFGIASVLLGTTLYFGMNNVAHADMVNNADGNVGANSNQLKLSNTMVNSQTVYSSQQQPVDQHSNNQGSASQTSDNDASKTYHSAANHLSISSDSMNKVTQTTNLVTGSNDNLNNNSTNTISRALVTSKVAVAGNGGYDASWGKLDLSQWQWSGNYITGYTGDREHIIVPNSVDVGHEVNINSFVMEMFLSNGVKTVAISKTGNGHVIPKGSGWNAVFDGNSLSNSQLQKLNLGRLDISSLTDLSGFFANNDHLTEIDGLADWDLAHVNNISFMFVNDSALTKIEGLSSWNTSSVTDMAHLFDSCSSLQNLDGIVNWDTSHVDNMTWMLAYDSALKSLDLSKWDVSHVQDFTMFAALASGLTSLGDLSNWNTSSVTTFNRAFFGLKNVKSFGDLSNWQVGKCTDFDAMFYQDAGVTGYLDFSKWDMSKATDIAYMLYGTSPNAILNVSNWNLQNIADDSRIHLAFNPDNNSGIPINGNWIANVVIANNWQNVPISLDFYTNKAFSPYSTVLTNVRSLLTLNAPQGMVTFVKPDGTKITQKRKVFFNDGKATPQNASETFAVIQQVVNQANQDLLHSKGLDQNYRIKPSTETRPNVYANGTFELSDINDMSQWKATDAPQHAVFQYRTMIYKWNGQAFVFTKQLDYSAEDASLLDKLFSVTKGLVGNDIVYKALVNGTAWYWNDTNVKAKNYHKWMKIDQTGLTDHLVVLNKDSALLKEIADNYYEKTLGDLSDLKPIMKSSATWSSALNHDDTGVQQNGNFELWSPYASKNESLFGPDNLAIGKIAVLDTTDLKAAKHQITVNFIDDQTKQIVSSASLLAYQGAGLAIDNQLKVQAFAGSSKYGLMNFDDLLNGKMPVIQSNTFAMPALPNYSAVSKYMHPIDNQQAFAKYYDLAAGQSNKLIIGNQDQLFTIKVHRKQASAVIDFVDPTGNLVDTQQFNGNLYDTIKVNEQVPDGYVLYNSQKMPNQIVLSQKQNHWQLLVAPRVLLIKPSDHVKSGALIPGTTGKYFDDQVLDKNLIRTITRIIYVHDMTSNQTVKVLQQPISFTRDAYLNVATGKVSYTNWLEGQSQIAPQLIYTAPGYATTIIKSRVIELPDDLNVTSVVDNVYTSKLNDNQRMINFIDAASGSIIKANVVLTEINGKFILKAQDCPQGYHLLSNQNTIDLTNYDGGSPLKIYVARDSRTYSCNDPVLPAEIKEPLTKTVTRTIKIIMPNGHVRLIKQNVKFVRTATVQSLINNPTQNEVVYSNWQPIGRPQWNKLFIPKHHGYKLVINGNCDQTPVNGASNDVIVNVQYVKI